MRRAVIVAAMVALVAIGGGLAIVNAQGRDDSSSAVTPSPMSAPQIKKALVEKCAQAREEHSDAVTGDCNYGEATLTTP